MRCHSADSEAGLGDCCSIGLASWNVSDMSSSSRVVARESSAGRWASCTAASASRFFSASRGLGRDLRIDKRIFDTGDRFEFDVAMRRGHQPLPDHRGQRAAGHLAWWA